MNLYESFKNNLKEAEVRIPRNANKLTLGDEEYFKNGSGWTKTSEKDKVIPTVYSTSVMKGRSKLENLPLSVTGVDENYKPTRTHEYKVIQGNYGYGWDDLTSYDTKDPEQMKALKDDIKAYRDNEPNASHRVITRREPIQEAAGPEIPAYLGDPNDDPDWHPESKRAEKPEPEVTNFKDKNRPEPTGEIVTTQDLNYPGVTFETTNNEHLYVRAWWSDNGALDDEERDEWEDPDDVWGIYYTIYNAKGEEVDGGIMYDYDYGKWSSSELANNLLSMSGYTKHYNIKVLSLEEVEDLLEESQTQEIEGIVSDMVKSNPKAEKYLDEYLTYINTLEPKNKDYNNDTDKFNNDWEDWYQNTANVIYNPTAWNKFIEWVKEKYGEEAVKGLDEEEELKKFKFNVYTESAIGSNASASRLANTVYSLKEAEDLVKGYRAQKLKAHYAIKKD